MISINATKILGPNGWTIRAEALSSDIPTAIFSFENTGTNKLGDYAGIISFSDLASMTVWNNIALPIYEHKFVRSDKAVIQVKEDADPQVVVTTLMDSVQRFVKEYKAMI